MCDSRCWLTIGAVSAGLAVAAGAFAAHGLDRRFHAMYAAQKYEKKITLDGKQTVVSEIPLAEKYLADFKTGAEYQMYHALALIAVGLLAHLRASRMLAAAGSCFVGGSLAFSGGLYAYTLTAAKSIAIFVVPVGGLLFLAGWIVLAIAVCCCREAVRGLTRPAS
ncbi:MAG TPA: DUF423 domain-containing protein [Planctomycetaceae bacterium]|nr:DUF423 domain-containing protein [Planctomycetaceae bacterium]